VSIFLGLVGFTWLCTVLSVKLLIRGAAHNFVDQPNDRSLHQQPTPRVGGLGMALGIASGLGAGLLLGAWQPGPAGLLWGGLALSLIALGLIDDCAGLAVLPRFLVQLALCCGACWLLEVPLVHAWWVVLALAWSTNLYNFMDGSDGLAGAMAVSGYASLGLGAYRAGATEAMVLCALVVAASAGFLVFNKPRAKVFMGDAGSVVLGFGAAAIGLAGWREGWWKLPFAALCFAPFYLDASFTLLRRLLRGEKVWQAHRSHLYQRLILSGWSHGKLLGWASVLMVLSAGAAHLTFHSWLMGFMLLVLWCVLMLAAATVALAVRSNP
jgi:UDP-N-acetylmuramyl pentapeptide phosphotransferase/UDP-N-acetylglucosamine-1-phosphate transferase